MSSKYVTEHLANERTFCAMKTAGLLFIFLIVISCNSQNRQTTRDTTETDSIITTPHSQAVTLTYCPELVKEILRSSPRYKQLTKGLPEAVKKNGGTSVDIVLDKSPDYKKDNAMEYSANYEMQLMENYPDRKVNFAHFTYSPDKKELYEYDMVRDQYTTVAFDTFLLKNAAKYCK